MTATPGDSPGPRVVLTGDGWLSSSLIDGTRAHPARVYDYWLGGKDNFAADRELAEKVIAAYPPIRDLARENRRFLTRAVRYAAPVPLDLLFLASRSPNHLRRRLEPKDL